MVKEIKVQTSSNVQMIDISSTISEIVRETGIQEGICTVFVPHTTAAVTINENADPDVQRDMVMALNKIVPFSDGYRHLEGNSAAHIKASMMGFSEQIIIHKGKMMLGTWQGIYFFEFDGPRSRKLIVKVIEDSMI